MGIGIRERKRMALGIGVNVSTLEVDLGEAGLRMLRNSTGLDQYVMFKCVGHWISNDASRVVFGMKRPCQVMLYLNSIKPL